MSKGTGLTKVNGSKTTEQVVGEALHLAGSAVVTAGVAAALVLVAVPATLGVGIAAGWKALRKRR
ncbi:MULTISPECIES: hypothetical protein [Novosphingobium]|uniref:Uncharacterized protein n=1 Tax=Novosphingobium mathurense TaxID=428990 RepID=A0A1U6IBR7_9SPHN|nr:MULTISPECIES: hypothetical protein [Novosphingobium]SLK05444.1 hypothetical protein SAMN06295987_105157 [Novosphingobium mathurense]